MDVSSNSNFESAFEKCLELYGGIDVVVNNAGVEGEINWETQLQINFLVRIINLFFNRYNVPVILMSLFQVFYIQTFYLYLSNINFKNCKIQKEKEIFFRKSKKQKERNLRK